MLIEDMINDDTDNLTGFIKLGKSKGCATKTFSNAECKAWLVREGYCKETKYLFKDVDE
jgi:hypothetical protein